MTEPSHREIIQRVEALDREFTQHRDDSVAYRTETRLAHAQLAAALRVIGEQGERIEDKVLAYDRTRDRIIGALAAAGVMLAAIWWLVKARISALFGVEP